MSEAVTDAKEKGVSAWSFTKELAKAMALRAYRRNPISPDALKLAGKYEPGLLKLVALLKEYNTDLGKLAEKHPEPFVIDMLEEHIARLGLERKWKKPFTLSGLLGV